MVKQSDMRFGTMVSRWGMLGLACLLSMLLAICFAGVAQGKELTLSNASGKQVVMYYPGDSDLNGMGIRVGDWSYSGKVTKVHSNNKKVVSAKDESDEGNGSCLGVTFNKPGKAKVAYVWKGKKHVVTFVVKKYQNPVKSFKVGGKEYASKFKKIPYYNDNKRAKKGWYKGIVSVKAAKNWKLKGIYLDSDSDEDTKKIKNGKKVVLGDGLLRAALVNKKTHQQVELELTVRDYDD